jgi:Ca-activated chloride channel family protein
MNIVNPNLLFLLLILLPLIGLLIIIHKRYRQRFKQFADEGFWDFYFGDWSFFFFRLKMVLILAAFALIILALVRPQWDRETQDIKRSGLDIAICIDASKSMDATDIAPTRLQRAKDQIASFIDEQKGDRIALIPFAGTAFVQCPLTDDYEAAKMLLSSLDTSSIPVWGTDIGRALRTAGSVFDQNTKTRVVVLISDGEDLSDDALKAARELKQHGIIIYTMGVGTPEGATVKLSPNDGLRGNTPTEITTKLDNITLEKIASISGGEFFMITPTQDEITAILKHISSLEKSKLSALRVSIYKEQYQLFAMAALLLLLIEALLGVKTGKISGRKTPKAPAAALLLIFLFVPFLKLQALTLPWNKAYNNSKGRNAYKKQDYQEAEDIFGKNAVKYPKDDLLQFNHGNSLYKLQKDKEATEAWRNAINGKDKILQSKAWYNLGNQQFQAKQYGEAMKSYRQAILADQSNKPARENYDLAKRLLQKQQNKQNQQQRQDKQQPKNPEQQNMERILKALEQKEVNDRQNKNAAPQKMRNNKWW